MTPFETIETDEMVAACNGGGGALGHPRIYMNLAAHGQAECPYCSRLYVNRRAASAALPEAGVVMPSGEAAGAERQSESPTPRQSTG